jgi:putative phosphoribosyl transferase
MRMVSQFDDRADAGRQLATMLEQYAHRDDIVVLGLPRGGVPVAYEIARALHVPLDIFVVRKLGVPGHEELAMGAIATGGVVVLNQGVLEELHIPERAIDSVAEREWEELNRREALYRGNRPSPDLRGMVVILVDDGLATGSTMRAAVNAVQLQDPARVVVAVPVAAQQVCDEFAQIVDEMVCAATPDPFYAVGLWYRDFSPTSDQEVRDLLEQSKHAATSTNA